MTEKNGVERSTATKILRRMLDERGVEYMKVDFLDGEHITSFDVNGREYGYHEFPDGGTLLRVWHPTPEQAIAATLGNDGAGRTNDGLADLQAENAKLRELCKDMMAFVEDDDACERCGHDAECVEAADGELVLPYEGQCLMLDLFADRMRELGVVVDG